MRGQFTVPDDFDTMDQVEIEKLFYGDKLMAEYRGSASD
jgi:hypothetical protein